MGFQGDLDSVGLANVFQNLTSNQQTGTLHVSDGESELTLIFSGGMVHRIHTGERDTVSFRNILIARGLIDTTAFEKAQGVAEQQHKPVVRILIEMGLCNQPDLEDALRFMIEEQIYDLFTWTGAKFTFEPAATDTTLLPRQDLILQAKVNTNSMLLEAMRRLDEWERLRAVVPTSHFIPILPEAKQTELFVEDLSSEEKHILTLIDGASDIDILAAKSGMGRFNVMTLIARLLKNEEIRESSTNELRLKMAPLLAGGKIENARAVQRRYLELKPDEFEIRRTYANLLAKANHAHEAAQQYDMLTDHFCNEKRYDEASAMAEKATQLMPEHLAGIEKLANLYVLQGNHRSAVKTFLEVVHFLEKQHKNSTALERLNEALQDLPDNEDLLRAKARLLSITGEKKAAAEILDQLAKHAETMGNTAAAVNDLRAVQRVDPSRRDITTRIEALQMHAADRKRLQQRRLIKIGMFLLGIGLLLYFGNLELSTRSTLITAHATAKEKAKSFATLPLQKRLTTMQTTRDSLNDALNLFSIFDYGSEAQKLRDQLNTEIKTIQTAAKRQFVTQNDKLERARDALTRQDPDYERGMTLLRDLAANPSITKPVLEAQALLKEWESKLQRDRNQLSGLLTTIGNKKEKPAIRFEAYNQIRQKHPEAINLPHPNGIIGLTLPVKISCLTNTQQSLHARIFIDGKLWPNVTPCIIEMPLHADTPIQLYQAGFGKPLTGMTTLTRDTPILPEKTVSLKRVARWQIKVKGEIRARPVFSIDGSKVYVATLAGTLYAINASTGSIIWQTRPTGTAHALRQPLLVTPKRLLAVADDGAIMMLNPDTGASLWSKKVGSGPLKHQNALGFSPAHLSLVTGRNHTDTLFDLIITSSMDSPLFAIDGINGNLLWPRAKRNRDILQTAIERPMGNPFTIGWEILLLDQNKKVHILFTDGAISRSLQLPIKGGIENKPLFIAAGKKTVLLFIKTLGGGLHAFKIILQGEPTIKKHWQHNIFANESLQHPLVAHGDSVYAGFRSGQIVRIRIRDGAFHNEKDSQLLNWNITGPITVLPDRILAPCYAANKKPKVAALSITKEGIQSTRWIFSPAQAKTMTAIAAYVNRNRRRYIFGAGNTLFCLDDGGDS